MSFLTPLALIAGLLAIPIVLLYMLRLRRREISVSSTYLWQQVLRDREANTPWQRLRRNLLLFLQLIILALLVLALARPYITVPAVTAGQTALLIDASASMSATDSDDGTRLAEAQRQAHAIIDTLSAGDMMTIVRVADVPEVLTGYTADAAILHAAVDSARPSNAPADWTAAFTLAAAGAAGAETFSVVVISDGGVGEASGFPPIPGRIEFVPVGRSADNLALSALAARSLAGQPPQLFAEITNYSSSDVDTIFSLNVDGALFSAERYTIPARGRLPVVSSALPEDYETLQAALTRPTDSTFVDYLPVDDTAFAVSPGADARRVLLMTAGNRFIEQALRSLPNVRTFLGDVSLGLPAGDFNVIVLDGWLPTVLPDSDLLIVNPPTSSSIFTITGESDRTASIRVDRSDPRMTFVDFDAVNVLRFRLLEAAWATPLVMAEGGPLLLAGETGGRQVAILPFDLTESDLPLQITFPILINSLLEWYTPEDVVGEPSLDVGEPEPLRPPLDTQALRVTLPDGRVQAIAPEANPVFGDTHQPGLYTIEVTRQNGEVTTARFAVNLFAPDESEITPRAALTLGQTQVTAGSEEALGQQEYWPWLALLALIVMLIEWYAYHRRNQAPPAFKPLAGWKAR